MIRATMAALLLLAASLAGSVPATAGWPAAAAVQDTFPHARHANLFTDCAACHDVANAERTARFPTLDACTPCHDGSIVRQVTWTLRPARATNLQFTHSAHPETPCEACHAVSDSAGPMQVGRARGEACTVCHAQDNETHLTQAECSTCHVPLTEARTLLAADLARFPKPPTHDSTWIPRHRDQATSATCAVCHTRDFCSSCHVNASRVAAIAALPTDARVATLARARRPRYPVPATHQARDFVRAHGLVAERSTATCANCHARESCLTCHREEERVVAVTALPRRVRGGAPGVDLSGIRPPSHTPDYELNHRVAASAGEAVCSRCHTSSFCSTCHAGARAPTFHGANFVQRHSEGAWTRSNDCSACHQTEAFCLECHRSLGMGRAGIPRGKYHDTTPLWLFGHGGVARRSIETCTACHTQSDCLACHSPYQGWGVNPHGSGFNPRVGDRNAVTCRICHVSGIPGR